ncbi:MAG: zinc-ribbon domain-containing protein [Nitrospina sp.]|nr:zinc-ribbon domain-containing protein [Nitrospina sp.]
MALISCPECGKQISNKALSCTQCGFPFQKVLDFSNMPLTEKILRIILIIFSINLFLIALTNLFFNI